LSARQKNPQYKKRLTYDYLTTTVRIQVAPLSL